MKKFTLAKLLVLFISFQNSSFCRATTETNALFPEDGSQAINKWFYSEKEIRYMYKEDEWQSVLQAFMSEGITPINTKVGSFFQDLAFFDNKGNLLIQHFPENHESSEYDYEKYFKGFTMEIFERGDYGQSPKVNLLREGALGRFGVNSRVLKNTFLEGGASISGRFKNGDDYLIVNHSAYLGMKYYFEDRYFSTISETEIKNLVESDLGLLPGNFIVLEGTSHIHLDTFIKALPGARILIDSPAKKSELLRKLFKKTKNKEYLNYLSVNENNKNIFYEKAIKKSINILRDRFEITEIPGVFSRRIKQNNSLWKTKDINFFNGVSGLNKAGKDYYITNMAVDTPELEDFWTDQLKAFGFSNEHVHFVGRYKGNAGLDCMGSPSP